MEGTPQPVDTNRLMSILGASKKLMKVVDSGEYETGNIDRTMLEQDTSGYVTDGNPRQTAEQMQKIASVGYTEERVRNSRLPEAIKKIMIEKPIQQPTSMNHTFTLDDVPDLVEKPMGLPRIPKTLPRRQIAESISNTNDNISISREDLSDMVNELVNEKLLEFFVQNHNKRITEDAVKKTINLLIKEGKLKKVV